MIPLISTKLGRNISKVFGSHPITTGLVCKTNVDENQLILMNHRVNAFKYALILMIEKKDTATIHL
jgi:hypothetical protein